MPYGKKKVINTKGMSRFICLSFICQMLFIIIMFYFQHIGSYFFNRIFIWSF